MSTIAGSGGTAWQDGVGTAASFFNPTSIVAHPTGSSLYVCDTFNHRIRAITVATGLVTSVAGNGKPGYLDQNVGPSVQLNQPQGIDIDPSGALWRRTMRALENPENGT